MPFAFRGLPVLFEAAGFVASALKRGKRSAARPGVGIAAAGGYVKLRRWAGEGQEERCTENLKTDQRGLHFMWQILKCSVHGRIMEGCVRQGQFNRRGAIRLLRAAKKAI